MKRVYESSSSIGAFATPARLLLARHWHARVIAFSPYHVRRLLPAEEGVDGPGSAFASRTGREREAGYRSSIPEAAICSEMTRVLDSVDE